MPSPIGHTLAGIAVVRLMPACGPAPAGSLLFLANAPDLDIALGLLRDEPNKYHGDASHSLGAAVLVGAAAGAVALARGRGFGPCFGRAFTLYASHLALDYLGKESEDGMQLLWPISRRRFGTHHPVFKTLVSRRGGFIRGLFNRSNARAIAREVAVILPFTLAAVAATRGR